MHASVTNPSLVLLAFILDEGLAKQIRDFQEIMIKKFELPKNSYPNLPPNIPFLGAKSIAPGKISDLEMIVGAWASEQKRTSVVFDQSRKINRNTTEYAYLEAFPIHNPYSASLTELFYSVFSDEEKDAREPYNFLLVPIIKPRIREVENEMTEITQHLLSHQFDDCVEINSISILKYEDEKGDWAEYAKFEFGLT